MRFIVLSGKMHRFYGIDGNDNAVMGFSAGGILAGEMLLNFDGLVNGTALDPEYVPDDLDGISADAAADGMIYSFHFVYNIKKERQG